MMRKQIIFLLSHFSLFLSYSSCEVVNSNENNTEVILADNQILIQDKTGKNWNVTHAVNKYGFVPEQFQFGLGPFAIPPILEPTMVEPGEAGYPGNNADFLVIGTTFNNDTRAYPLHVLSQHEVADENFDSVHVAVAY
jgi:hypothetical protein